MNRRHRDTETQSLEEVRQDPVFTCKVKGSIFPPPSNLCASCESNRESKFTHRDKPWPGKQSS